jgi:site-specific recombinase XerC
MSADSMPSKPENIYNASWLPGMVARIEFEEEFCATPHNRAHEKVHHGFASIGSRILDDVAPNGYALDRATVRQRKTGRPVKFEITEQTRQAIDEYLKLVRKDPGNFLFAGRRGKDQNLTTRQYARLVSEWIGSIGLDASLFGTHSLRRTKATLIYRRTGNLRAVQLLLGHTKVESTVRYLGIEIEDALAIAEKIDI